MREFKSITFGQIKRTLPVLVFFTGIWYFCIRNLGYDLEYVLGDFIDSRFINYLLEHGFQWSLGNADSFWNAGFMYPNYNVVALSDSMLGTMPFYGIWRLFGFGHETAYQLWWITICALNYWSAYFVIKRWFGRRDLAIIAAWIFAFSIFNLGQMSYLQMNIRFVVPLVIYAMVKMMDHGSVKYFAIFSFGIVYQFYCVIYTGFFLFYFCLIFMIVYSIVKKDYKFFVPLFKGGALKYSTAIIVLSILAMLWLFLPYFYIALQVDFHSYESIINQVPTIKSFLFPHPSSTLWGFAQPIMKPDVDAYWLHYTFAGMIPLVGIISAPLLLLYWRIRKIKPSALQKAVSITVFIICLFFVRLDNGKSLYYFFYHLPGIGSLRVLNRFIHVALFFIIIGLVFLLKKIPVKWGWIFIVLVFIDNTFDPTQVLRVEKSEVIDRRNKTNAEIKAKIKPEHKAIAILNNGENVVETCKTHLDAMNASIEFNLPTINGYSSTCTGEFWRFMGKNTNENLQIWLDYNHIDSATVLIIDRTDEELP